MISLLIVILIIAVLFKITGFLVRLAGSVIGAVISILGWLFVAWLAITIFKLALYAIPVILIVGAAALITGEKKI